MKAYRIGNDIKVEWPVEVVDNTMELEDLDLSVEVRLSDAIVDWHNYEEEPTIHEHEHKVMANGGVGIFRDDCMPPRYHGGERRTPPEPFAPPVKLPWYIEDGKIIAIWSADAQLACGDYDILLYAHKDDGGQGVVDQCRFVRLVAHTAQADAPEEGDVEAVVKLQPLTLTFSGLSAYEVAVSEGFVGTKAEWLQSLKQPAEDAAAEVKEYGDYAKEQGDYAKAQAENVQDAVDKANAAAATAEEVIKNVSDTTAAAEEVAQHPTYVGEDNYVYEWDAAGDVYVKTAKLVKSQPLTIDKKYSSVAELEADTTAYNDGQFAIVDTGDIQNTDNARLYIRKDGAWEFVVDMSGMKGDAGKTTQWSIGTVALGTGLTDVAVKLTEDGEDTNGNPKYKINFVIPRLTYDDLTAEQIAELQKPANDMIATLEANEEARVENEELRVAAETARAEAETARQTAETNRVSAENARQTAEIAREKSETTRMNQETARQLNESNRKTAETARETNTQTAIDNANAAATSAKETAETAAAAAKATAEAAAEDVRTHTPKIVDGYWALWNPSTEEYEKTEYKAVGYSPYVSAAETWMVYDDETGTYVDSGQSISNAYNLTKEKVEAVLIGDDITSHGHKTEITTALEVLNNYVQKVTGKDLSSNDFTDELKTKLESLSNYDDTAIQTAITAISDRIDTLVNGSTSDAIDTFNEIVAFLTGITDDKTLTGLLAAMKTEIEAKIPETDEELSDAELEAIIGE